MQIESCNNMLAVYAKDKCPNQIQISPSILQDWLGSFNQKLEEVQFVCSEDMFKMHSFSEPIVSETGQMQRGLTTELMIDLEEFDDYSIHSPTTVIFNLKEFKV